MRSSSLFLRVGGKTIVFFFFLSCFKAQALNELYNDELKLFHFYLKSRILMVMAQAQINCSRAWFDQSPITTTWKFNQRVAICLHQLKVKNIFLFFHYYGINIWISLCICVTFPKQLALQEKSKKETKNCDQNFRLQISDRIAIKFSQKVSDQDCNQIPYQLPILKNRD